MICLGGGVRQSIHGGSNNQDESMGNIFANMKNTGVIIQGDISAGDCFVLRDSIPMKFFKQAMIMKLKTCTIGKIFSKICLKAIRDTFFQYLVSNQRTDEVRHEGKGGWVTQLFGGEVQILPQPLP